AGACNGWRRRRDRNAGASGIEKYRIGNKPSRNPVVTYDQPGGVREVEFRHALIPGRTLAVVGLDVGLVALRNLRKIDLNAAPHGEAPLVGGLDTGEGRIEGLDVVAVIARRDLMGAHRDLRDTPGLLHAELADEIRQLLRRIVADRTTDERRRPAREGRRGRVAAEEQGAAASRIPVDRAALRAGEGAVEAT